MLCESVYEEEILELITVAWLQMTPDQKARWEQVKIAPEKWVEEHYRDSSSTVNSINGLEAFQDEFSDELDVHDLSVNHEHGGEEQGIGFWVVAIAGNVAIWYNNIVEGFNLSSFKTYGCLSDYSTKQDDLEVALSRLMSGI